MNNTNAYSRIYGNVFIQSSGPTSTANEFSGTGGGIYLECNDYSGFDHDWYLSNANAIATTQGFENPNYFSKNGSPSVNQDIYINGGSYSIKYCNDWVSESGISPAETAKRSRSIPTLSAGNATPVSCNPVEVSDCPTLPCEERVISGVKETEKDAAHFNIYPNPTTGKTRIESDVLITTISVFDIYGRLVSTYPVNNLSLDLSIGNLPKGNYLIKITTKDGYEAVKKLVLIR